MTNDQEHQMGTRAAFLIIAVLCALCMLASLPGCTIPAMLKEYALRAAVLSRNARTLECAESAESAARAALAALEVQSAATKMSTGATAPAVRAAMRKAERECAK